MLALSDLRIDGGTQPRCEINLTLVNEYAEAMTDGETFPPVIVFFDGVDHWLADGFHRYHAASSIGLTELAADIKKGTKRDAVLYSVGANADHGQRRTNADKRRAVLVLLNDEEWAKWSDREIARRCRVGYDMVARHRPSLPESDSDTPPSRKYTDRHGNASTMHTENIGKTRPEPHPEDKPALPLGPPADGLQFARMAIADLEQIRDDDIEHDEALAAVADTIQRRRLRPIDPRRVLRNIEINLEWIGNHLSGFSPAECDNEIAGLYDEIAKHLRTIRRVLNEKRRASPKAVSPGRA